MPIETLRDASGRLQGFVTRSTGQNNRGDAIFQDLKGHHTGYFWEGKTRDTKLNQLSAQLRPDLVSPMRRR